jgi:transposase
VIVCFGRWPVGIAPRRWRDALRSAASTFIKCGDREHESGVRSSFQIGGHRRSRVEEAEPTLRRWIAAEPGLTLEELRARLADQGIAIKIGALWHQLNKWNLTFKKNTARQRARARGRAGGAARME